jgi:hypothetical protein
MAIAGLTYPASELEQGLKAARGPASLTQMSGLGGLGVTPADIVGLETENTIARMQQRAADALSRIKAPSGGADGYSGLQTNYLSAV